MPGSNIAFCNVFFQEICNLPFVTKRTKQDSTDILCIHVLQIKKKQKKNSPVTSDPFFSSCFKHIEITTFE